MMEESEDSDVAMEEVQVQKVPKKLVKKPVRTVKKKVIKKK